MPSSTDEHAATCDPTTSGAAPGGETVAAVLGEMVVSRPDHPLLVTDGGTLTYREAASRSAALAKGLLAAGVGRGSHVGVVHPNGAEFVVAWLAAARIGAVTVPISTFSTAAELRQTLRGADIEVVLASRRFRRRDYVQTMREAAGAPSPTDDTAWTCDDLPMLRRVFFDTDPLVAAGAGVDDSLLAATERAIRRSERLVIVHTSGSTSRPKGVIHQHGPLIAHVRALNSLRRYTDRDVLFSNSPFFWIGGFAYSLLGTLIAGATLVCSNAEDSSVVLDLLERTRPTMCNGFAASAAHLAEDPTFGSRDLSSIRRGNLWPIMPAEVRPVDPALRHNMLGMTEAGSVCLASEDESDQPEHRRGSFGKPVPGLEARIVDPASLTDHPAGVSGELWLRGPAMMEGYYGRTRSETFTRDGWYRTGDLFHVDDDGFYYFDGRLGDMIKTSGANVSPREVEAAIAEVSGLTAYVLGVDDADRGQVVAAAVVVPPGGEHPDEATLRAALRGQLSPYKVPRLVRFVTADLVPTMSSGKLDVPRLRAQLAADG